MSSKCTIHFDNNPQAIFHSGQLVSGAVELITAKEKTIRAIYITINGFAHVRWTESRSRKNAEGKKENYIETCRGDEQYLSSRTVVLGQDTGNFFELHAGQYVYPFQIQLPPKVPSSFNGLYGQIRYEVVLTIDRPWKYDNIFRQPFTVISPIDLNANPIYKAPIEKKEEKHFCCGTCFYFKNDPIIMKFDVPYSGFAPGQNIDFKIFVDNESNVDCREVKIKLLQSVQFTTRSPETKNRSDSLKIAEKKLGSVLKLSRKEYKEFLKIPSIAPSTLETCSIINIKYSIDVNLKIGGLHRNLNISVPVTIGTVPLMETVSGMGNIIATQPHLTNRNGDHPPPYSAFAVPSYEEATHGGKLFVDKDEEEKYGKVVPFIPKYPVYHNQERSGDKIQPSYPPAPQPPKGGQILTNKNPTHPISNDDIPDPIALGIIPNPTPTPKAPAPTPMPAPKTNPVNPVYPTIPPVIQPTSPDMSPDIKPKPIGWNA